MNPHDDCCLRCLFFDTLAITSDGRSNFLGAYLNNPAFIIDDSKGMLLPRLSIYAQFDYPSVEAADQLQIVLIFDELEVARHSVEMNPEGVAIVAPTLKYTRKAASININIENLAIKNPGILRLKAIYKGKEYLSNGLGFEGAEYLQRLHLQRPPSL